MRPVLALVFAVSLLAACSKTRAQPDFDAYCAKAAPCENKSIEGCVEDRRKVWSVNQARGCGAEDEAMLACDIEHGRCERSGSLSAFTPGDECRDAMRKKSACLEGARR